jgi:hypothetical protein
MAGMRATGKSVCGLKAVSDDEGNDPKTGTIQKKGNANETLGQNSKRDESGP